MGSAAWPLVGREEELRLVATVFDESDHHGLVLAGPSGVGKTRLLDEALDLARGRGWSVERVTATPANQAIPFSPFGHILAPEDHPSTDRLALLLRMTAALSARAHGSRLIVAVDDAHWLNEMSAALVHQIAASGVAFVLVALRTGSSAPDSVTALWKDDLARRVDIQALALTDMEQLVAAGLGGPCDPGTARQLARVSGGNVLFLRELVVGGLEAGSLVQEGTGWRWCGPLAMTGTVVELVEARMGRLEHEERELLEIVAVSGGLEAALLDGLGAPGLVERLERKGLVDVVSDGRRSEVRVAHPMYGEVVQLRIPAVRAQAIRRRLADILDGVGARRGDDRLRVATWRLESDGAMSGESWNVAAQVALARFDFGLAERLARAAVDAGGGYSAAYALGCAFLGQGRGDRAETTFAAIAAEATTDAQRAQLALTRAENLLYTQGRSSDAESVLRHALDEVSDPRLRDELMVASSVGRTVHSPEDHGTDEPSSRASRSPGVPHPNPGGLALTKRALIGTVLGMAARGDTNPALAAIAAWLEQPANKDDAQEGFEQFLSLRIAHWAVLRSAGRYDAAESLALEHYQRMLPHGAFAQGVAAYLVGASAMMQGRPRTALPWLEEAVILLREQGRSYFLSEVLAILVQVSAVMGDLPAATAAQAEAESLAETSPRSRYTLQVGRIWLLVARGELAEARALASAAATETHELAGNQVDEALILKELARLGDAEQAAQRLRGLAVGIDGPLVSTLADYATALADDDGAALDHVTSIFETMGDRLGAAEAAVAAAAAPHHAGRRPAARTARRRAVRLIGRCEGAQTPALAEIELPRALSRREAEIAHLAATGLSDRQIAERLIVSVRTVESHLRHTYAKLGVHGRQDLATALAVTSPVGGPTPEPPSP